MLVSSAGEQRHTQCIALQRTCPHRLAAWPLERVVKEGGAGHSKAEGAAWLPALGQGGGVGQAVGGVWRGQAQVGRVGKGGMGQAS